MARSCLGRNGKSVIFIAAVLFCSGLSAAETCKTAAVTPLEHLQAAECLAANKEWKTAEEHFRVARQSRELQLPATLGHARVLFHLGQPFDAMLELEDLLKTHPDSVPALRLFATLLSTVMEEIDRSIEIMERCSSLTPEDPEVWQHLGNLYLLQHRDKEALERFARAVQLRPTDAYLLACLAYAHAQCAAVEEAQKKFDTALKINAEAPQPNVMVWLMYAKFLREQRRWSESRALYDEALKLEPHSSEAYFGRAVANENLKNFVQAEADALSAIREYPTPRKDAFLLLIRGARAQKDQTKTEKYLNDLKKIEAAEEEKKENVRQVQGWLFKAEPLLLQGKYIEAAVAYEEVVKRAPLFYEAYFALGMCYGQTAQLPRAEEAFRKYLALQPLSPDGHASLGLVLVQLKRLDEAKAELERALEIDPAQTEAGEALARIRAAQ